MIWIFDFYKEKKLKKIMIYILKAVKEKVGIEVVGASKFYSFLPLKKRLIPRDLFFGYHSQATDRFRSF